jgi:hypothetical protein
MISLIVPLFDRRDSGVQSLASELEQVLDCEST